MVYENGNIPENAVYIVKIFKKQKDISPSVTQLGKLEYEYIGKRVKSVNVTIHRRL